MSGKKNSSETDEEYFLRVGKILLPQIDDQIFAGGGWASMKHLPGGNDAIYALIDAGILEEDGGYVRRPNRDRDNKPLRKKNPSRVFHGAERLEFIKKGAKLYEDFSGHEAEIVAKTKKPKIPGVLIAVGMVDFIGYTTVRDGQEEKYIHKFKRAAAPRFCVSPDGKQIFFIDGSYDFTERGIVDRT